MCGSWRTVQSECYWLYRVWNPVIRFEVYSKLDRRLSVMGGSASTPHRPDQLDAFRGELEKPLDASDITSGDEAIEEVKRLRAQLQQHLRPLVASDNNTASKETKLRFVHINDVCKCSVRHTSGVPADSAHRNHLTTSHAQICWIIFLNSSHWLTRSGKGAKICW